MKKHIVFICLISLISIALNAQDTNKIYAKIKKVTVYKSQAQIEKSIELSLKKGFNEFILAGNTDKLETKSIQFNNSDDFMIMEFSPYSQVVRANQVAEEKLSQENRKRLKVLKDSVELLNYKIKEVNNLIVVLKREKRTLENMKVISNPTQVDTIAKIKDGLVYFREKIAQVNAMLQIKGKEIEDLNKQIEITKANLNLILQGDSQDDKLNKTETYIKVNIYCEKPIKQANLEYTYMVGEIQWEPFYDIKLTTNKDSAELTLKANLIQYTNEDWEDVKLIFSTEEPNNQGQIAKIEPEYFSIKPRNYQSQQSTQSSYKATPPQSYNKQEPQQETYSNNQPKQRKLVGNPNVGTLVGTITDAKTNEPLPFVNVIAEQDGKQTGGAQTDMDGNYQIQPLNAGYYDIVASFIGYTKNKKKRIYVSPIGYSTDGDLALEPTSKQIDEVVITEYAVPLIESGSAETGQRITMDNNLFSSYSYTQENESKGNKSDAVNDITEKVQRSMIGKEYQVEMNYTIKNNDNAKIIPLETMSTNINYKYYSVPKNEKVVYLSALMPNWEDLELMDAAAKIYVDNNYVSQTWINPLQTNDTLSIPVGKEKRIVVNRKLSKSQPQKIGLMGNSAEVVYTITLNVKNNTQNNVNVDVKDQIPLSNTESITITPIDKANAKYDEKTGKLSWDLSLKALESRIITFTYSVRYPKDKEVILN